MKPGDHARVVAPVIGGPIAETRYNIEFHELEHLLVYKDRDGEVNHRWFLESDLVEMPAPGDGTVATAGGAA